MNQETKNFYFVNPWVDFTFIGGISIITFFILLLFQSVVAVATIAAAAGILTWICNNPHFAATTYKLYKTKENRQMNRRVISKSFDMYQ